MARFCSDISQNFWQTGGSSPPPLTVSVARVSLQGPCWPCHSFQDFFQRTTGISGLLQLQKKGWRGQMLVKCHCAFNMTGWWLSQQLCLWLIHDLPVLNQWVMMCHTSRTVQTGGQQGPCASSLCTCHQRESCTFASTWPLIRTKQELSLVVIMNSLRSFSHRLNQRTSSIKDHFWLFLKLNY